MNDYNAHLARLLADLDQLIEQARADAAASQRTAALAQDKDGPTVIRFDADGMYADQDKRDARRLLGLTTARNVLAQCKK